MIVVAVDSAELSGVAVLVREPGARERLVHSGVVRIRTAADVEAAVVQLAAHRPDVVAIEEPFIHPRQPLAGLVLARLLGRWLQAFEARAFTCVTIPAALWQPAILTGLMRPRATRPERKSAALVYVRSAFGLEATEDQADAICLGAYVLRTASRRAAVA